MREGGRVAASSRDVHPLLLLPITSLVLLTASDKLHTIPMRTQGQCLKFRFEILVISTPAGKHKSPRNFWFFLKNL